MSFKFATERSYDPSSFAQLLQRRERSEKRPQSSLLKPTGRVMRDDDNTPSSRPHALETCVNAPRTSSAGLLTPPDSQQRKRRGSTGQDTPTKRHQSSRVPPQCSVCGSRAQIKQCQSCAAVYLCSHCIIYAPLAHPFRGHSFRPTDHKATVVYGGMDKVNKLSQDLDDNHNDKDKELVYEDGVDSLPKDTGHDRAAPFPCRFCGKHMDGEWYECQDCLGAAAHFCFQHTWLHDRLHTSHTTKAISVGVQPGEQARDHNSVLP
ncbi:hypothetical protein INS49_002989 [Diaporthe citri]|uniref:uncharacterized protein n=1 Tax=Diaporthe citri TaxID=83186 RepID=UPI001C7F2939|nr:uncharacterized protein INS49_002989 [Diaporthe citri]KAG6368775.1 hypothetical protein INS49_002989 [Diaporthe citri]